MTCNPAIATCLDTALVFNATTLATGLCSPVATPMCGDSSASAYSASATDLPWSDAAPRGTLGYFRPALSADAPHCTADVLPPLNQDLSLSAYHSELPAELRPYIAPLLQLEADFGVPVSFRIVNVRLSTGEAIPQIHFFRTGEESGAPLSGEPGSGGSGGGLRPSPEAPSSLGLTVGLLGGTALIVAFDHLLIRPLIDNGLMPEELHSPVMFASVMVSHAALYRAGLVRTAPGAVLPQLPTLMGFQVLAGLLMEGLDVEPGLGRDFATLALSMMPFYLARHSPMLAEALSTAGRGLTIAELETLSTGAATLRLGAVFARALGWLALIDLGMRTVTWATSHPIALMDEAMGEGSYEDNLRAWNLTMMSHDIINQEDCGAFLAGAFGMFMMVADGGLVMFDGEYEDYLLGRRSRIQRDLVRGSDEFGRSMHTNLAAILSRHIEASRGETPGAFHIASVDWDAIRTDIETFYESEENEDAIEGGYELVDDATGHRTRSGIEGLIEVVSEDGEIDDFDGFRDHMRNYAMRELETRAARHHARALELGLAEEVNGVFVYRTVLDPSELTPDQRAFYEGDGLTLATEISFLTLLRQALAIGRLSGEDMTGVSEA